MEVVGSKRRFAMIVRAEIGVESIGTRNSFEPARVE